MEVAVIDHDEAVQLLGISFAYWKRLVFEEKISRLAFVSGQPRADYIRNLAKRLELERQNRHTVKDSNLSSVFTLFKLEYEYVTASREMSSKRQKRNLKYAAEEQFQEMVILRVIESRASLVAKLTPYVVRSTIDDWFEGKRLPFYAAGKSHYVMRATSNHLVWLFERCIPASDASRSAGVAYATLSDWVHEGKVQAYFTPGGRLYLPPEAVIAIDTHRNPLLTQEQVAQRLQMNILTLREYLQSKSFKKTYPPETHRRGIPLQLVELWEERFSTLNEEFRWLAPVIGERPRTLPSEEVRALLGLSDGQFRRLCEQGLLPFYNRSFYPNGNRQFVAAYISGLADYAQKRACRIESTLAYEYLLMCKATRSIV